MMRKEFIHSHAAHCESGAMSTLLRDRGIELSEALVFGIGCGLFFLYFPHIKMGGIPLITYRSFPGSIFKNICSRLNISFKTMKFSSQEKGMAELDRLLDEGISVGLQTSVFWLPYFPRDMRFQFNAHNLVVYGKDGDEYLISDPVFDHVVRCPSSDLKRARFAKGLFAPKGHLYYPVQQPDTSDMRNAVRKAIRFTCKRMLGIPFLPFIGVRGILYLSAQIRKWPEKLGKDKASVYVGSVVRMQEEIGTGGAGFRFMYASFLQEAAEILNIQALEESGRIMGETGDLWREFAVKGAQLCKGHLTGDSVYRELSDIIRECAHREERIYHSLFKSVSSPDRVE